MNSRKLPVSIQNFEDLITTNNLYVDKTDFIHKLVSQGKCYFLLRPRRFGKSLMLSTLKAYFQGKKDLFIGLRIDQLENQWEKYPVFYIDLVGITREGSSITDTLNEKLENILSKFEEHWNVTPSSKYASIRLLDLLQKACKQSGKKVVVLVDEYDKPLLESLNDPKRYDEVKQILRSFYSVFKEGDQYLRFVMLTGVSKFSGLSIFSDLNNLQDISMYQEFHNVCGITKEELTANFKLELEQLSKHNNLTYDQTILKMEELYDGYRFAKDGDALFNPFSVLNCLTSKSFDHYWFASGTPSFLIEQMLKFKFNASRLADGINVTKIKLTDYRVGDADLTPLLYQSGYLTIKPNEDSSFFLKFPNGEVEYGFFENLLQYLNPNLYQENDFSANLFVKDLMDNDLETFMKRARAYAASFPSSNPSKTEHDYRDILYGLFTLIGADVRCEKQSALGRSDIVVRTRECIYLFEIKYAATDSKKLLDEAILQIDQKGYLVPYSVSNLKLVKIAAIFSKEERTLSSWKIA